MFSLCPYLVKAGVLHELVSKLAHESDSSCKITIKIKHSKFLTNQML